MKNFKVLSGILPAAIILLSVYFFSSGFVPVNDKLTEEKSSTSVPCPFLVQISSDNDNCLTGNYFYCVDGGNWVFATGDFLVELPCGFHTICVESSSGCAGRITIPVGCPCDDVQVLNVVLSPSNKKCSCAP